MVVVVPCNLSSPWIWKSHRVDKEEIYGHNTVCNEPILLCL
jgi:hypothetical protein